MSDVERKVDELVSEFDSWFQEQGNEPIIHSERAIIKTFWWFLLNVRPKGTLPGMEAQDAPLIPPPAPEKPHGP